MRAWLFICMFLFAVPVMAQDLSSLETGVIQYANRFPDSAYDHFMEKIESGATTPEQAVYLYGVGIAHEKLGNTDEAINDYLSAEILGYDRANKDLQRLRAAKSGHKKSPKPALNVRGSGP